MAIDFFISDCRPDFRYTIAREIVYTAAGKSIYLRKTRSVCRCDRFRYLLPKEDFLEFKRKLTLEISSVNKNLIHIAGNELLAHMGFPPNWKNITRYQLTP